MKKNINIFLIILITSSFTISCLKEDNVTYPVVNDIRMFMTDNAGKDSLVTSIRAGQEIKIQVSTDADMISVWPGGNRITMKKSNSSVDSVDIFDNPMLVISDDFDDYGLVAARGLNGTLSEDGWYVFYTYPEAGEFDLNIVCTNHGYDGPDLRRVVHNAGSIRIEN